MTFAFGKLWPQALLGLVASSCVDAGSVIPDRYLGVNATLREIQNRAPLVATFTMDPERQECLVDHWRDLHPDRAERAWALLTRIEVVEIESAHSSIADYADARFVFGDYNQVRAAADGPSLVLVAPWAGTAEIRCGDEPVNDALVLVWWMMGRGTIDHGTSDEEALATASANVEREGLVPVVDLDLTVRNVCLDDPMELDCVPVEPRPLTGS